jgi:hypothetical protein
VVHEPGCPPWCVAEHGVQEGEENWLHLGEPLVLAAGVTAQLVMSKDPETGVQDGPYVTLGDAEYTLPQAAALGHALSAIAERAGGNEPCPSGSAAA